MRPHTTLSGRPVVPGTERAAVVERSFSVEFALVAACCRWPLSPAAVAAIHDARAADVDWPGVLLLANRHRVAGLVQNALSVAGIVPPPDVAQSLAAKAERLAQISVMLAGETVRLQQLLGAQNIPVAVLKGAGLAQLAYGSLKLKHSRDIDLLVPADRALIALQLLEREGYSLVLPAAQLSDAQRRAVVQYGKEIELAHPVRKTRVELQWRAAVNPYLLKGIDANSATQDVFLSEGTSIRTFADEDLFAYLCVHGAHHDWFRLKWLADVNAVISQNSDADLIRLFRHAQTKGAGLCAGQALMLCHQVFERPLPAELKAELAGSKKVTRLTAIAFNAMADMDVDGDRGFMGVTKAVFRQFLLGQGWAYFAAQCRIALVGLPDAIRMPLPALLHFLYPIMRLPLWLGRRSKHR